MGTYLLPRQVLIHVSLTAFGAQLLANRAAPTGCEGHTDGCSSSAKPGHLPPSSPHPGVFQTGGGAMLLRTQLGGIHAQTQLPATGTASRALGWHEAASVSARRCQPSTAGASVATSTAHPSRPPPASRPSSDPCVPSVDVDLEISVSGGVSEVGDADVVAFVTVDGA